jgi:hypothetical protein
MLSVLTCILNEKMEYTTQYFMSGLWDHLLVTE